MKNGGETNWAIMTSQSFLHQKKEEKKLSECPD